ncbi:MAG: GNAT family N-acetyltransferase [Chloroflexi bacterium]|nr:GNAT family N-acetyltransferase [Chloroflexota bacterium]
MKIIDLPEEHEKTYFVCLEDWSEDMKEGADLKANWYHKMKDKGLRVKLALDDNGEVGGMIQYLPIEYSFASGEGFYFISCIWVHGFKQGRGNFQGRGMGTALLKAAEDDAKALGAKGMVARGMTLPFWIKASWFKEQGYAPVDIQGLLGMVLLWKPFNGLAIPPKWVRQKKKPEKIPGKVTVTAFLTGGCPAHNAAFERAKRAAAELGDKVVFQAVDIFERDNFLEWGIPDALFIDGRRMSTIPPPSYEKIKGAIAKRLKKL